MKLTPAGMLGKPEVDYEEWEMNLSILSEQYITLKQIREESANLEDDGRMINC